MACERQRTFITAGAELSHPASSPKGLVEVDGTYLSISDREEPISPARRKSRTSKCVFRNSVTDRFGIVTAEFGNVTDGFGGVTDGSSEPAAMRVSACQ